MNSCPLCGIAWWPLFRGSISMEVLSGPELLAVISQVAVVQGWSLRMVPPHPHPPPLSLSPSLSPSLSLSFSLSLSPSLSLSLILP